MTPTRARRGYSSREKPRLFTLTGGLLALSIWILAACGNGEHEGEAVNPEPDPTETAMETTESWPPPAPTAEPATERDVDAIAEEAGCDSTPAEAASEPWLTDASPKWLHVDDLMVAPANTGDGNWYSGRLTFVWWVESWEALDREALFTGRNLDTGDELQPVEIHLSYEVPNGVMSMSWPVIPEDGCWEFEIGDHSFIAYVLPEDQQPTLVALVNERAAIQPYDIPADCNVNGWIGPTKRPGVTDGYWLDVGPFDVWERYGLIFAEGSHLSIGTEDPEANVSGSNVSNPALTSFADIQPPHGTFLTMVGATMTFPVPGCWDLTFEAEGQTMDATVYVYPDACRREAGEALPTDCMVPD